MGSKNNPSENEQNIYGRVTLTRGKKNKDNDQQLIQNFVKKIKNDHEIEVTVK